MEPQRSQAATAALEHLDWVRALARSLVRDPGLADDIAQETWLAALRKPASGTGISRGWLASVVRNAVRQEHRRGAIRREHEERARVEGEAASTDAWSCAGIEIPKIRLRSARRWRCWATCRTT